MFRSAVRLTCARSVSAAPIINAAARSSLLSASSIVSRVSATSLLSTNQTIRFFSQDAVNGENNNHNNTPVESTSNATPPAGREFGTVKWFDSAKGFGFITREGSGSDLFVHYTAISGKGYRSLEQGQRVEFAVADGRKGICAKDVVLRS